MPPARACATAPARGSTSVAAWPRWPCAGSPCSPASRSPTPHAERGGGSPGRACSSSPCSLPHRGSSAGVAREPIRRADAFRELAAPTAAESEAREQAAIAAERVRIGHELQDIIAHSVSAMVMQAGGARRLLRTEPERARDSILSVEQTGREALADLRRLLGMLRRDDDPRALAPQPGLDQLPALVESHPRTPVSPASCVTEGEPVALTPGIDLVGYRVIEAALAEAPRHAQRATRPHRPLPPTAARAGRPRRRRDSRRSNRNWTARRARGAVRRQPRPCSTRRRVRASSAACRSAAAVPA